jgi:hypothetical protein
MSTENSLLSVAEKEAEAAVSEFIEMRTAILGRLSPEALRCVALIFERRTEKSSPKTSPRENVSSFVRPTGRRQAREYCAPIVPNKIIVR